jgi:hypothetical protein
VHATHTSSSQIGVPRSLHSRLDTQPLAPVVVASVADVSSVSLPLGVPVVVSVPSSVASVGVVSLCDVDTLVESVPVSAKPSHPGSSANDLSSPHGE